MGKIAFEWEDFKKRKRREEERKQENFPFWKQIQDMRDDIYMREKEKNETGSTVGGQACEYL